MIFDVLVIAAVCDELSRSIINAKIERVTQPTPFEVVLRVYSAAGKQDLYITCSPDSPGFYLSSRKHENPPRPYAFCMLMRKYLDGGRITGIKRPMGPLERVVSFECQSYDGAPLSLVVEVMGRHSNIILINAPGVILGSAKHITNDINRYREILPGIRYQMPPRQREKLDPFIPYPEDGDEEMSARNAQQWLLSTFSGVSPTMAREVSLRLTAPRSRRNCWLGLCEILTLVQDGGVGPAAQSSSGILTEVLLGKTSKIDLPRSQSVAAGELPIHTSGTVKLASGMRFSPVIWTDEADIVQGVYPIALAGVPAEFQILRDTINGALDSASASIDSTDAFSRLKSNLLVALRRSIRHKLQEEIEIGAGVQNSERAEEYQQSGDLIQANRSLIEAGTPEVSVVDYYAVDESRESPPQRTIALDPAISLHENAERYYKKARKARESLERLTERMALVHEEIGLLRLSEHDAEKAETSEQVEEIHSRVSALLGGKQPPGEAGEATGQQTAQFEGHKIRVYRSVDGWEILVGENATANDYLTTHLASPTDIWLHVRAATSAHGVIRAQNRPASVSPAAITYAAELVAARSEVKHSSLIPVDYTLKKYVRKPRKSAPGAVTYQNEKTVFVNGIHGQD